MIHQDNSPLNQPDGFARFILNGQLESISGDRASITNRVGNSACYSLTSGFIVRGSVLLDNNTTLIFSHNFTTEESEIGIADKCSYSVIIKSACLRLRYPIKGVHIKRNNVESYVYFIDGINPDRYINLNFLEDFYTETYKLYLEGGGLPNSYVGEKWNCSKFSLTPDATLTEVRVEEVLPSGGYLKTGSYVFAFRYEGEADCFAITSPIPITPDSNTDLLDIDGGFNNPPVSEVIGGISSSTSKAIRLSVTGFNTSYSNIEVFVIQYISGDGISSNAFSVGKIPITIANILYWNYFGLPQSAVQVDINDILVNNAIYKKSKAISLVENRLVRGNVYQEAYDWREFQKSANNIQAKFDLLNIDTEESASFIQVNYRGPIENTYFKTFMRDEIESFGIQFLTYDGQISPVLHIPGRKKDVNSAGVTINPATYDSAVTHNRALVSEASSGTGWDSCVYLNSGTSANDMAFLAKSSAERWEIYNTAYLESSTVGQFGYYETSERYPDIRDANNVPIFPHTGSAGSYVMDKIRHFRMPDSTLCPHLVYPGILEGHKASIIGIRLSNITVPAAYASKIIGYRIMKVKKDETNTTILDKGYAEKSLHAVGYFADLLDNPDPTDVEPFITQSPVYNQELSGRRVMGLIQAGDNYATYNFTSVTNVSQNYWNLYTPKFLFENSTLNGAYIKIERLYSGQIRIHESNFLRENAWNLLQDERWWTSSVNLFTDRGIPPSKNCNRIIEDGPIKMLFNDFIQRPEIGYKSYANQPSQYFRCTLPYDATYNDTIDNGTINNDGVPDNTNTSYYYVAVKRYLANINSDLFNLAYEPLEDNFNSTVKTTLTVYGGDVVISRLDVRKTFSVTDKSFNPSKILLKEKGLLSNVANAALLIIGGPIYATFRANQEVERTVINHLTFYTESTINTSFRNEGYLLLRDHKDQGSNNELDENYINAHTYYPKSYREDIGKYLLMPVNYLTFYAYNKDYSIPKINTYRSFDRYIERFVDTYGKYPNRLIWSEPQLSESVQDNFRAVLASNYKDITLDKGEITDLIYFRNTLYVRTVRGLFQQLVSEDRIETSENILSIGTGEFLSLKERELVDSRNAYAGSDQRFNTVITEFGVFYTSHNRVYRFYESLEPITEQGLSSFYKNNGPLVFLDQYKNIVQNDYVDDPIFTGGVGYLTLYNPRYEIVYFIKKDYSIIDENQFDLDYGQWATNDVPIPFSNTADYKRLSFNISYDIKNKVWASFHSWIPIYGYNDDDDLYTTANGNSFWKHDTNTQSYYGIVFPFIVEFVTKDIKTFNINNVIWLGYPNNYSLFNKLQVYNEFQAFSANLAVKTNPYSNVITGTNNRVVALEDKLQRTGQVRNFATAQNFLVTDPTLLTTYYTGLQGYMDKDLINLDYNKSKYQLDVLSNKWAFIRLIQTQALNINLNLYDTLKQELFR